MLSTPSTRRCSRAQAPRPRCRATRTKGAYPTTSPSAVPPGVCRFYHLNTTFYFHTATKTHKGYNRDGRPFEVEDKKETGEDGLATLGKELLRAQMNGKK